MRFLFITIAAVATLLVVWRWTPCGRLGYFRDATELVLPAFPEDLEVYDNGEGAVAAYMVLEGEDVRQLLGQSNFVDVGEPLVSRWAVLPRAIRGPSDLVCFLQLSEEAKRGVAHLPVLGAGRCNSEVSWHAILVPKSRRLWVEVLYPDAAGSLAGCLRVD